MASPRPVILEVREAPLGEVVEERLESLTGHGGREEVEGVVIIVGVVVRVRGRQVPRPEWIVVLLSGLTARHVVSYRRRPGPPLCPDGTAELGLGQVGGGRVGGHGQVGAEHVVQL